MSFRRGVPGTFDGPGPTAKFTPGNSLRKIGKVPKGTTGTRVTYWPDRQIFLHDAQLSFRDLQDRARQTSFLVPGLALHIADTRTPEVIEETYLHQGGISEFCEFLASGHAVTDVIRLRGTDRFTETVPILDEAGHMEPADIERDLEIDIAVRWGEGYETRTQSYVNIIATPKGGTACRWLRARTDQGVRECPHNTRLLKNGDEVLKEDVLEGMTAVVTYGLLSRSSRVRPRKCSARQRCRGWLPRWSSGSSPGFWDRPRWPPGDRPVRCWRRMSVRLGPGVARQHREAQRRKNALESSLPAKLVDCRSNDVDRTELFIVEGDSALGTAKLARNSEFQALLPIRGKILNVQKASIGDMLKNAECGSIIQVSAPAPAAASTSRRPVTARSSSWPTPIPTARTSDACWRRCSSGTCARWWLPGGSSAVPPLHRFELTNARKGQEKYIYTYSDAEYQRKAAELTKRGLHFKEPQRYKGLGEMDADQLAETTMNPRHRTLRRMTVDDGLIAETTFEMLMGNDVGPRKEFIIDGAYAPDAATIDA